MQDLPTTINPTPTYVIGVKDGGLVLVPISADLKGGGDVAQYGIVVGTVAPGAANAGTGGGGGGSTTLAALTDITTYNLPSKNGPLGTALAAKAPLASPALTGNPTAPTQTQGDNSTNIANTAYVDTLGATKATRNAPASETTSFAVTSAANGNRRTDYNSASAGNATFNNDATSGLGTDDGGRLYQAGAGALTVVAGTATVSNPASLALTTTGAGSFIDWERVGTDTIEITAVGPAAASGGASVDYTAMCLSQFGSVSANTGNNTLTNNGAFYGALVDSCVASTPSATEAYADWQYRPRVRYTSTGTANKSAGFTGTIDQMRLDDATPFNGRFPLVMVGGISDALTSCRTLLGLVGNGFWNSAMDTKEPSVDTSAKIAFGADSTDTNWQLIFGASGSAQTKIDTGLPLAQFHTMLLYINKNSAATQITVKLMDLTAGTQYSHVLTSTDGTMPSTAALYTHQCLRASVANAVACSIDFAMLTLGRQG